MKWSIPMGRLFSIPIKVHVTLVLLLAVVGIMYGADGGLGTVLAIVVTTGAVFGSVLLHELGHALCARRFGIATREIVLLPIGGAALLASEAKRPAHDLLIALAGPLTSVALGLLAYGLSFVTAGELFTRLAELNIALGLFNLIPAFPLDGGRVLRAALTHWMGRVRATSAAARLGRLLAVAAVVLGFWYHYLVIAFLGVFVFIAASSEERSVIIRDIIGSRIVRDVMVPVRRIFGAAATVDEVGAALQADSTARAFPVAFGERILGVLHRQPVLEAIELGDQPLRLNDLLDRNVITTGPDVPLVELLTRMGHGGNRAALVVHGDEISGLVLIESVLEEIRRSRDKEF